MTPSIPIIQNKMEDMKRTDICHECGGSMIKDGELCRNCDGFGKVRPKPKVAA